MARIPPSPHPIECPFRYYLAYDRIHDSYRDVVEDDVVYGLVRIPTVDAFPGASEIGFYIDVFRGDVSRGEVWFYNDTSGKIDLLIRELSQTEWETMEAFELFPILYVFSVTREIHKDHSSLHEYIVSMSKVHFNDH